MSRNIDNKEGFILNISTGILHTKECGDGEEGLEPVSPGKRKHYGVYSNAVKDDVYLKDHRSNTCIG